MSRSIETRVAKLEKAAGDGDLDLGALSDEELTRISHLGQVHRGSE